MRQIATMNIGTKATAFLLVLLLASASGSSHSQPQQKPETFASFWREFTSAIAKNDKESVASLTQLPFYFNDKDQDRAGFVKIYNQIFTRSIRRCMARAKPMRDANDKNSYDVFCGEVIFVFGKADGKFKFLSFGPND